MDDQHSADPPDDTPEARFGAVLRRVRVQAGVTVRRLATDLGRAHSTISDFENGRRLPGVEVVEQYEDYFGLSRGELGAQRERARAERLESPRDATLAENLGDIACPYMGLRAFECDDAALFFGRETQVAGVLARLAEVRFVAVLGASGSGKSSFVRAGLMAGISATAGWRADVVMLTPGEHPLEALASAVNSGSAPAAHIQAADLRADPRALRHASGEAGGELVIVVDQLEELFTLCGDELERRAFVDALITAWRDPASSVVVIVALRADFYGRVAAYPEFASAVVAHQALLGPMSTADLRRAIELPAATSGLMLQAGLTDTMLEDLAGEPGALPLLSHALLETWNRRRRLMLTVGGYREAGGVREAIAQTAERTLQALPEADLPIARSIFLSLTEVGEGAEPTRRRADRVALETPRCEALDGVLSKLVDARLISMDEHTIEVAHEALIRHWPRLRGWIDTERDGLLISRRLTRAAREWDTLHREPAALYRGARLATAREWAAEHSAALSTLEQEFLTASHVDERSELRAAKRRSRRLRFLAAGLAALSATVGVLATWALGERRDANSQRTVAQRQAAAATSLALTSSAVALLESRPDLSLSLGFEAHRLSPRVEARSIVLSALVAARDPGVLAIMHGHIGAAESVAFSPDGHTLLSTGEDGTIRLWDARTHKQLGAPLRHTAAATSRTPTVFTHDGRTVAVADDKTIRLWAVHTHKQLGKPIAHPIPANSMAFSPDGHTLAYADGHGTIRLWNVDTHRRFGQPLRAHGHVAGMVISASGRVLASSGRKSIRLWNLRTQQQVGQTPTPTGFAATTALSRDGHILAFAPHASSNTIRLWDVRRQTQIGAPMEGHRGSIGAMAFSQDGRVLASGSLDTTVRLWGVGARKQIGAPLRGHAGVVLGVSFDDNGRTLGSSSRDGTIRLWNLRAPEGRTITLQDRMFFATDVAFNPNGRMLASGSHDGIVRFWDARSHAQLGAPLVGHTEAVTSVAFSRRGLTLASASADKTVRLWSVRTRKQLGQPLRGHTARVLTVRYSRDGRLLASGSEDRTIRLWNLQTRKQLGAPLRGHPDDVRSVAISPDGRTLASAGGDVRLWDLGARKQRGEPLVAKIAPAPNAPRTFAPALRVTFSPDGRTLAVSGGNSIGLWDVRARTQLGQPLRGGFYLGSVAFSRDGRTLASGELAAVGLWDVSSHKRIGPRLTGLTQPVGAVVVSPDGGTVAAADVGGTIRTWDNILWSAPAQLKARVCNLIGRGLTRTEWAQHAAGIPYRDSCA